MSEARQLNTRELLARVRRIEIRTRRAVDQLTAGAYRSVFKGKGIEFDEVREYIPGDEVRDIEWNVTARMHNPFVKRYIEERELSVFLLVDISASGIFGSVGSKQQLGIELATLIAFSAIRNNDKVGLILFSSEEELHLPPRKGRRHGLRLVRELVACERSRPGTDIAAALEILMRSKYRQCVVFLISDFIDDGYEKTLRMAGMKHDLVAVRLLDPLDLNIADAGLVTLEDAEVGDSLVFPSSSRRAREAYIRNAGKFREHTRRSIIQAGVDLIDFRTDQDYLPPLMQFFRKRESRGR